MLTYEEALAKILTAAPLLPQEDVALERSAGRLLAFEAASPYPLPAFSNSQMDGYAVRSSDIAAASHDAPARLPILAISAAGDSTLPALPEGAAVRIMTGAPIPHGADAVVPQEDITLENGAAVFSEPAEIGQFIRVQGEDVAAGDVVVAQGTRIGPGEIAMLAATGKAMVTVRRRPRVAILATGDELMEPGTALEPGHIYNSNAYSLQSQVEEAGGEAVVRRIVRDDPDEVRATVNDLSKHDLILSSGGVSVGDRDFLKQTIEELGELIFWRVAIRPGKPVAFGRVGNALYLGLPGNPVSSLVTFELFARPLLLKMQGAQEITRRTLTAVAGQDILHDIGRSSYVRVRLETVDGVLTATTTGRQGSAMIRSIVDFDGLLLIPADSPGYSAGEPATVILVK